MGLAPTAQPAIRSGDLVADIVADVVATTRRNTAVYSRNLFHAPWGFGIPAMHVASFQVVTSGACWLMPEGGDPVHLARGDVVLVPSGAAYAMVDAPGSPVRQLTELVGGPLGETPARKLILDGSGPVTGLLCGGYLLDTGPAHPLTALLPPVVHIAAGRARGTGLAAAVELLSDEVDRADPGAGAVITSLVELLFVYVLRAWLAEHGNAAGGWVAALHDPVVGRRARPHPQRARPPVERGFARPRRRGPEDHVHPPIRQADGPGTHDVPDLVAHVRRLSAAARGTPSAAVDRPPSQLRLRVRVRPRVQAHGWPGPGRYRAEVAKHGWAAPPA